MDEKAVLDRCKSIDQRPWSISHELGSWSFRTNSDSDRGATPRAGRPPIYACAAGRRCARQPAGMRWTICGGHAHDPESGAATYRRRRWRTAWSGTPHSGRRSSLCGAVCFVQTLLCWKATPMRRSRRKNFTPSVKRISSCVRCSPPDRNDRGTRGLGESVSRIHRSGKGEGRCAHTSQLRRGSPRSLY